MPTDYSTTIPSAEMVEHVSLPGSKPESFPPAAVNGVDINALVDARVEQKLQSLLGPLLTQLLKDAGKSLQGSAGKASWASEHDAQQPGNVENGSDNQEKLGGIRFVTRNESKGNEMSAWHDPRKPQILQESTTTQNWLTVTRVIDGDADAHEITISDKALRDRIKECLASFIAHVGENVWQQDEVVLVSEVNTLLFNYKILDAEALRQPADETRNRLRELLDILRAIYGSPVFRCIEADIGTDFSTEMEFVWPIFCPGKLLVAKMRGFDAPQLLKIDSCILQTIEHQTTITVFAWMWDWDGQKLVRSTYAFSMKSPKNGRVNPKEWDFYPIEFYEDKDGRSGLDALRRDVKLLQRRGQFIAYTGQYAAKYQGANVLKYSGDAFGDAPAFQPFGNASPMDSFFERMAGRLIRNERPESKLIKLQEDIVLDTENYCRRVGQGRKFADQELARSKFCECSMCMDQDTRTWYNKMDAISKAKGANTEPAIKEALNMPFNDNDLLLAPRVFGFALNKKEWCQFSLDRIERSQTLEFKDGGAEVQGLVFPTQVSEEERKDIFKLISGHKRVIDRQARLGDTISGKGESLILLFHGQSGTGKTLYAESLAKACQLGLFKVGTNDIGLEVAHAERRLKEIFGYAEFWNTVLLIDEADVLLDTRGQANEGLVTKNALVSVLLREVEYFKGILIMTTNRVRAFDPAIMSRIHHAVDFEGPTQKQEMELWNLWYDRLERDGGCTNCEEMKTWMKDTNRLKKRNFFTGREIRNVFLTAQILAEDTRKQIKIDVKELERAYRYKHNFLADTEGKINEAKTMAMAGMRH